MEGRNKCSIELVYGVEEMNISNAKLLIGFLCGTSMILGLINVMHEHIIFGIGGIIMSIIFLIYGWLTK